MEKAEDECAREVLEVVPAVMRFIRTQMRGHRALDLSVPQFRSLVFIERREGTSLGEVAENLGLTSPSACVLIDGLTNRGLITRAESPEDRRRLTLTITAEGKTALAQARGETLKSLSALLAPLSRQDIAAITRAMDALHRAFAVPARPVGSIPARALSERRTPSHGNS
jgi:DNA-binding MarR family transcriptional regulator